LPPALAMWSSGYDFAIYGAFATVIASTYFPRADRTSGLLATFAIFAAAFVFRPVGAVLFGRRSNRRGRRQVLATVIILMSVATAGIGAAAVLARLLPPAAVEAWAWRLAFLLALPLGVVGLYVRLRLDETPRFRAADRSRAIASRPGIEAVRAYPGRLLVGFGLVAAASLTFNTFFVFLPSHLVAAKGVPLSRALAATLGGLALLAIVSPVVGRLSDRLGRKPLLATGTLALLVIIVPTYRLVLRAGPVGLPLGYLLMGLALSCFVLPTFLSELVPTRVRATALSITYGLASAFIGGAAPFVDTLLVRRTGSSLAPAFYATAVTVAAAVGLPLIKETATQPLDMPHTGGP
jgi:MFS transporter, MHS family, proline/betaine transporter